MPAQLGFVVIGQAHVVDDEYPLGPDEPGKGFDGEQVHGNVAMTELRHEHEAGVRIARHGRSARDSPNLEVESSGSEVALQSEKHDSDYHGESDFPRRNRKVCSSELSPHTSACHRL